MCHRNDYIFFLLVNQNFNVDTRLLAAVSTTNFAATLNLKYRKNLMENLFAQLCDWVLRVLPILQMAMPVRYRYTALLQSKLQFYLVICLWNVDQGTIFNM